MVMDHHKIKVLKFAPYFDDIVCSAVMVDKGNSTARKTAMTTINIRVVLLASLCLLSLASLELNPNIDNLLPIVPRLDLLLAFLFSLLLVLLMVSLRLLCSALLIAENKRILRMTREIQGTT